MMPLIPLPHRSLLSLTGADAAAFLQGLVTNDVLKLSPETPLYACMLSPQGKILFDFLLYAHQDAILLDVAAEKAEALRKSLSLYKLRAKVTLTLLPEWQIYVSFDPSVSSLPADSAVFRDPRHPGLGWRIISPAAIALPHQAAEHYEQHRLTLGIPETSDFIPERSFPMEFGITYLHGISYAKGCYVGQEIVARNRTRGVLRKALHHVHAEQPLPPMDTPIRVHDSEIGQLRSVSGKHGLAMIRLDDLAKATREKQPVTAGDTVIRATLPEWFPSPDDSNR